MVIYGLTDVNIQQHTSAQALSLGKTYYKNGRVITLAFDANKNITATVRGSQQYKLSITFSLQHSTRVINRSMCSCPVGSKCKHVAAALLKAREQLAEAAPEATLVSPTPSVWRTTLEALSDQTARPVETTVLGILFELQHTVQARGSYYGPPRITQPTSNGKIKLGLRPVMPGATGRWINNGLSWSRITQSRSLPVHAAQQRWFKEFWAMYLTAHDMDYYSADASKWLYLDDFSSGSTWSLLQQAQALGITFILADRNQTRLNLLDTPFVPTVAITSKKDVVHVAMQLRFEGNIFEPEHVRFFGDPAIGVYAWRNDPRSRAFKDSKLIIAPLASPLSPSLQQQITKKTRITIPANEVEDFRQQYFPQLVQQFAVISDGKIELPTTGQPKLVINIRVDTVAKLDIHLHWRYTSGSTTHELPLRQNVGQSEPIIRAQQAEQRILTLFIATVTNQPSFFSSSNDELLDTVRLETMAAVTFVTIQIPQLEEHPDAIIVEIEGTLPTYEEFADKPVVQVGTSSSDDGSDWFDLHVSLKIGDSNVPMEQLLLALGSNEPYLLLETGVFFRLDHPDLLKLKRMLDEARSLQDTESGGVKLSKFQAGLWEELASLGVITQQAEAWQNRVRGLLDATHIPPVKTPADLQATLRPYQSEGLTWLAFLHQYGLGGILADDMGLGKTLQTLALLLHVKKKTPVRQRLPHLVIAPTSVAANWAAETARFAPTLSVVYMQKTTGKSGQPLAKQIKGTDVVITSYALCRFDETQYLEQSWGVLVLDEAQFVKNFQSKGHQVARKLTAQTKIALTGTPMENNVMELWSLLSVTAPGLFPSHKHFSDAYQKPIERQGDKKLLHQLRQRVRPLMLRRTKEQVAKELPPKIEQILELELNKEHRQVYDLYLQRERQRVLGLLGDFDKNRFAILKAITTLRQLSLDPKLVDADKYRHISSTKLDALMGQLNEVIRGGHRALVFSQFTRFLSSVRAALDTQAIPYAYLDGATKNRGDVLKTFKSSGAPVFLISLKAGGFGLNLTEADYCFLLDPWWNPAVEQQAIDRAHRIGQTKPVMVYRLISKGTIEEKVMALKARKATLFKSIMDDGELFSSAITATDIQSLFDQ